jgi:HSP20 family molecular chaperone IbpA
VDGNKEQVMDMLTQRIPVNVFQDDGRIMLTAPLPDLEAQNIFISVEGRRMTITGTKRGRGEYRRQFVSTNGLRVPRHRSPLVG